MPHPFPGMDPYLEHTGLWPDVHNSLIAGMRDYLASRLRPRYIVALEERTYLADPPGIELVGRPDVAVLAPASRQPPGPGPQANAEGGIAVEVPVPDEVTEWYRRCATRGPAR